MLQSSTVQEKYNASHMYHLKIFSSLSKKTKKETSEFNFNNIFNPIYQKIILTRNQKFRIINEVSEVVNTLNIHYNKSHGYDMKCSLLPE